MIFSSLKIAFAKPARFRKRNSAGDQFNFSDKNDSVNSLA